MKGKLIVCEGIDCSGKTTSIEQIINSDLKYVYGKGIGADSAFGRTARRFPSTFMFLSELVYNVYTHIGPNLRKGRVVLQDRYDISITSFVPNTRKWYNQLLIAIAEHLIPEPDAIVYFHLSLEERTRRLRRKGKKYEMTLAENPDRITLREREYEIWYREFKGPKIRIDTEKNDIKQSANILREFITSINY